MHQRHAQAYHAECAEAAAVYPNSLSMRATWPMFDCRQSGECHKL